MSSHATLDLRIADRAAHATFVRADALNSLSEQAFADLADVVSIVGSDPSIRALVIRGSAEVFSVGLDLDLLDRAIGEPDYFEAQLRRFGDVLLGLEALDAVTIAAVNGLTRAGGFELALACDLRVIADEARIGDVHTPFGMAPGGGSSWRLPRIVGPMRAKEIILTGRWLTGAEAAEVGIALRSVPLAELDAAVDALVTQLVGKSRNTLGTAKRMIERSHGVDSAEAVAIEIEEFMRLIRSPGSDAVEGFRAWQEKRPASWA